MGLKILIDTRETDKKINSNVICGQLLTPLTRYQNWAVKRNQKFAIDNGAFSKFNASGFKSLLERERANQSQCLFVAIPDIVGNARRTLEVWKMRNSFAAGWPMALVAQNGIEDLDIPWQEMKCLFLGGGRSLERQPSSCRFSKDRKDTWNPRSHWPSEYPIKI